MVIALGANDITAEGGMKDWIFRVFCLALFAVPKYVSPGRGVGVGQLGRGDADYWAVCCMQCGDVFVRSASDYHPGII